MPGNHKGLACCENEGLKAPQSTDQGVLGEYPRRGNVLEDVSISEKGSFQALSRRQPQDEGREKNYRFNKFFIHRLRPLAQITAAAAAAAAALND